MCFVLCDQYEMPDVCIIWQKKKKKNAGKNINIVLSTLIYGKDHFFSFRYILFKLLRVARFRTRYLYFTIYTQPWRLFTHLYIIIKYTYEFIIIFLKKRPWTWVHFINCFVINYCDVVHILFFFFFFVNKKYVM